MNYKIYFPLCLAIALQSLSFRLAAQCNMLLNTSTNPALCEGEATGSVEVETTNAQLPLSYGLIGPVTLNGSSNTLFFTIPDLSAGTYTLEVSDGQGCTETSVFEITEPPAISISLSTTVVSCNGGCDGSVVANAIGGTPPYSYIWPTGQTGEIAANLCAGIYEVTVIDDFGCSAVEAVTIDEPPALAAFANVTDVSCFGMADGEITVQVSGGIGPFYTFDWSDGFTDSGINSTIRVNMPAGTYIVVITDDNGCTTSLTVIVDEPERLVAALQSLSPACDGGCSGGAEVVVTGGTQPYMYAWNDPAGTLTSQVSGLCGGDYRVVVTDANNCITFLDVSIPSVQSGELALLIDKTDVFCNGNCDGTAQIEVFCGTPPYDYSWSDPAFDINSDNADEAFDGFCAGTYLLTVTDAMGLTTEEMLVFDEPSELIISGIVSMPSCANNTADGAIDLTVSGGTAPYSYAWSNGNITEDLSGLFSGLYVVTVIDDNGCSAVWEAIVDEPPPLSITLENLVQASCGMADGSIDISVSGGMPPYSFDWSNGNTTEDITGLTPDIYTVTVVDEQGCTLAMDFNVAEPNALQPIGVDVGDVLCNGNADGWIDVTMAGGTPPYSYLWDDPASTTTEDLSGLVAGNYILTVTDDDGCTALVSVTINEPTAIELSATVVDSFCTGAIDLTVSGGTPPYSYLWSNGTTTEDIDNLPAGTYSVTVTDNNGCTESLEVLVNLSDPIIVDAQISPACQDDGAIDLTVSGGTPPYDYDWSDDNYDGLEDIDNLVAGTYLVRITDAEGCQEFVSLEVPADFSFDIEVSPTDCDSTGGSATVVLGSNIANPVFAWSNNGSGPTQSNLAPGGYSVTVTDNDTGCRTHKNLEIEVDPACFVTISGYVYADNAVPDCVFDGGTSALSNILVSLSNGMQTFTNNQGYYEFETVPGTYEISIAFDPALYVPLCANPIDVAATTAGNSYIDKNFYLDYSSIRDLGLKVSKLNPRPGFTRSVRICVMNYGAAPMDGTLTFVHDPLQTFEWATIQPDSYDAATQTFTWNFTNHPPGFIRVYTVYMRTPTNVPPGTDLDFYFKVEPITGDFNPSDNEITRVCTVTNSYDPNDKQVLPVGEGPLGGIRPDLSDTTLNYHIRFQNTGTDTAFTVVVRDTLDSDLDIRDVVPGPSSHPYELTVANGNVLEFTFNDINLVDSTTNEPLSHGFVFFDVALDRNLAVGTEITNTAAIYFDFNVPIITNTVQNTVFGKDIAIALTIVACDEYEYNGQIYTQSTSVADTFDLVFYDSIVIADIFIFHSDEVFLSEEYCEGENPVEPGTYTTVHTNQYDCDSTVHLEVIVHDTFMINVNLMLEYGEIYEGIPYFADTSFVKPLKSIYGCDSTVLVDIEVRTTGLGLLPYDGFEAMISPNPSPGLFNVHLRSPTTAPLRWRLYSTIGKELAIGHWLVAGESHEQLDMRSRPAGVYLLQMEMAGQVLTYRLVKH